MLEFVFATEIETPSLMRSPGWKHLKQPANWRFTKSGEALVSARGANGFSTTYNLGQPLPHYVATAFKMIYEKSGADFERELAQKFTGAGKVHFATDEGKKELAAFIDYVRAGKRKPRVGE